MSSTTDLTTALTSGNADMLRREVDSLQARINQVSNDSQKTNSRSTNLLYVELVENMQRLKDLLVFLMNNGAAPDTLAAANAIYGQALNEINQGQEETLKHLYTSLEERNKEVADLYNRIHLLEDKLKKVRGIQPTDIYTDEELAQLNSGRPTRTDVTDPGYIRSKLLELLEDVRQFYDGNLSIATIEYAIRPFIISERSDEHTIGRIVGSSVLGDLAQAWRALVAMKLDNSMLVWARSLMDPLRFYLRKALEEKGWLLVFEVKPMLEVIGELGLDIEARGSPQWHAIFTEQWGLVLDHVSAAADIAASETVYVGLLRTQGVTNRRLIEGFFDSPTILSKNREEPDVPFELPHDDDAPTPLLPKPGSPPPSSPSQFSPTPFPSTPPASGFPGAQQTPQRPPASSTTSVSGGGSGISGSGGVVRNLASGANVVGTLIRAAQAFVVPPHISATFAVGGGGSDPENFYSRVVYNYVFSRNATSNNEDDDVVAGITIVKDGGATGPSLNAMLKNLLGLDSWWETMKFIMGHLDSYTRLMPSSPTDETRRFVGRIIDDTNEYRGLPFFLHTPFPTTFDTVKFIVYHRNFTMAKRLDWAEDLSAKLLDLTGGAPYLIVRLIHALLFNFYGFDDLLAIHSNTMYTDWAPGNNTGYKMGMMYYLHTFYAYPLMRGLAKAFSKLADDVKDKHITDLIDWVLHIGLRLLGIRGADGDVYLGLGQPTGEVQKFGVDANGVLLDRRYNPDLIFRHRYRSDNGRHTSMAVVNMLMTAEVLLDAENPNVSTFTGILPSTIVFQANDGTHPPDGANKAVASILEHAAFDTTPQFNRPRSYRDYLASGQVDLPGGVDPVAWTKFMKSIEDDQNIVRAISAYISDFTRPLREHEIDSVVADTILAPMTALQSLLALSGGEIVKSLQGIIIELRRSVRGLTRSPSEVFDDITVAGATANDSVLVDLAGRIATPWLLLPTSLVSQPAIAKNLASRARADGGHKHCFFSLVDELSAVRSINDAHALLLDFVEHSRGTAWKNLSNYSFDKLNEASKRFEATDVFRFYVDDSGGPNSMLWTEIQDAILVHGT